MKINRSGRGFQLAGDVHFFERYVERTGKPKTIAVTIPLKFSDIFELPGR
jgi:hypothetical protein